MKNIHVLSTDKPSRLRIGDNRNFVFGLIQNSITSKNNFYTNQNLYITNSENIKEGDWYYTKRFGLGVYKNIGDSQIETTTNDYKKIILTTDSDLIKDGVQAIDDDFLEWFVKNPSCEEVDVVKGFDDGTSYGYNFLDYKIIIPTEEPKQTVQEYEQQGLEKYSNELVEPKQVICYDKFDRVIKNGYYVDVQNSGAHRVYKKEDKQLYFTPYGKEERVSDYFSNDLILITYASKLIMDLKKEVDNKKQSYELEPKQERMYSEGEVLEVFEQFKMNLPFHYEFLVKEALQQLKKK